MASICSNIALTVRTLYSALMELRPSGQLRSKVSELVFLTFLVRGDVPESFAEAFPRL